MTPDAGLPAAPQVSFGFLKKQTAAVRRLSSASRGYAGSVNTSIAEDIVVVDETPKLSPDSE